ncbi:uncharacterized protein [Phyllobates terribilis]|uniref:uncharacterized protein n=1 Tax=Phyllobates terribilis TaxID=111132 RepID=UPI003CCAD4FC
MARRIFDLSNALHVEQVQNILLDDDETDPLQLEDLGEESDIDSEDDVEECPDESDADQDGESEEDAQDIETYYLGKDKTTKWIKKPPPKRSRTRSHNILSHLPGVIGTARNAKNEMECWNCLFTDDILVTIVTYTNQYMDTIRDSFIRKRDVNPIDVIELRAFISLLYLAGASRAIQLSLEELWGRDGDGIEKFSLVMNIKRFKIIMRCLCFDDRSTRTE